MLSPDTMVMIFILVLPAKSTNFLSVFLCVAPAPTKRTALPQNCAICRRNMLFRLSGSVRLITIRSYSRFSFSRIF